MTTEITARLRREIEALRIDVSRAEADRDSVRLAAQCVVGALVEALASSPKGGTA